jgi:hypothetical protein
MRRADSRSIMLVLRDWLDGEPGDDSERNARRLVEFIVERALSGHFGFLKLVLDMADGKLHPTAEDEMTFEAGCVLVMADDGRDSEVGKAA